MVLLSPRRYYTSCRDTGWSRSGRFPFFKDQRSSLLHHELPQTVFLIVVEAIEDVFGAPI